MKDLTIEQALLLDPEYRAQHILKMSPSMRGEVLYQFEFMARGSKGAITDGRSLREQYYPYFSDDWFKAVLTEVRRLQEKQSNTNTRKT